MAKKSNQESVYDRLRNDIISLNLQPGYMFSIKDICDGYGVGRTPVRDALIWLSREGLVKFLPQRGTMISRISVSKIYQEHFMRVCVEPEIIRAFLRVCDEESICLLSESIERQEEYRQSGDYAAFMDEDDIFHEIFYKKIQAEHCRHTIFDLSGDYRRFRVLSLSDREISEDIVEQHRQMLEAVKQNDAARIEEILLHHINRYDRQIEIFSKKYPELFEETEQEAEH